MPTSGNPYYSIDDHDSKIYHTYSDCPTGKKVLIRNRRTGTNNWPRCDACLRMEMN